MGLITRMDTVIIVLEDMLELVKFTSVKSSIKCADVELTSVLLIHFVMLCSYVLLSLVKWIWVFFGRILDVRKKCPGIGGLRGCPVLFLAFLWFHLWLTLINKPQLALRHELLILSTYWLLPWISNIGSCSSILWLNNRIFCLFSLNHTSVIDRWYHIWNIRILLDRLFPAFHKTHRINTLDVSL